LQKHDSKDHSVAEAALESGELITDVLMHGEVLAEIPFIGTAIRLCKAADSVRDRAFANKLMRFVEHLSDISDKQKKQLKEKMLSGTEEAKKVGEALFFVLERLTDLDKPALLSKIFIAYIDGAVTAEELRRLSHAIDIAYSEDLMNLIAEEAAPSRAGVPENNSWMQYLVPSGLTRLRGPKTLDEIREEIYCEITPLGHALRKACPN